MAKWQSPKKMRDHFLAWQCLIRQSAMREQGGRPSAGMRPRVADLEGRELAPALTVLLIPNEPEESTAFFRFQVMKTRTRATFTSALWPFSKPIFFKIQRPSATGW